MAKASGSIDLKDGKAASAVATNYITKIDDAGITVHPSGGDSSKVVINSSGMEVIINDDDSVAFYGSTARIGSVDSSRITIEPKKLSAYDADGNQYYAFGDVSGIECTLNAVGTGYVYKYRILPYTGTPTVKLDGVTLTEGTDYTIDGTYQIIFTNVPLANAEIEITFTPSKKAFYFTLGNRQDSSTVAGLSASFGIDCEASGLWSFSHGDRAKASATGSSAEGFRTSAIAPQSHAEGYDTIASGARSHAEGIESKAQGNNSHAEGNTTIASGKNSHAEGCWTKSLEDENVNVFTTASGGASHAEGMATTASGTASHSEGLLTVASGNYSHAEGCWGYLQDDPDTKYYTTASGAASHAEGMASEASGNYSHSEGFRSVASGLVSHAQNNGTVARGYAQTAIGSFNVVQGTSGSRVDTDNVLIIGNGSGSSGRSNAFSMQWNGEIHSARQGNVLWTGAYYMTSGHTATFTNSQKVSEQLNGIVLVWSAYANSAAQNYDWTYYYVPKWHVAFHEGQSVDILMMNNTIASNVMCRKLVYVYDNRIVGNDNNTATGTGYANNAKVLRAVIGV